MDKLGDRDLVLLRRRSAVDYVDVFGGPPMQSYSYEHRRSLASCRPQPSSRNALVTEKPAFGELFGPAQRRHLGDDFFSDIFPGSDSLSSRQWNLDHGPFLSPLPPQLRFEISSSSSFSPSCPSRFNYVEDQRQNYVKPLETAGPRVKDCLPLKDELHENKVRGRLKEFIEIFKFEASTKFKSIYEGGKRKPIAKSSLKSKIDIQVCNSTPKSNAEIKVAACTKDVTLHVDSANKVLQVQESYEDKIPSTYICSNVHIATDSSSKKNYTLGPSSDSTEENIEKYNPEDLDGCLVEQLSQELTETQQVGFIQNQINAANAKIMEWSKGKEENIRSLLSTLQYVLWPESGWKPIRLSDIIEVTSVKKAYQKALLCLHPDKLQQRSAAEHQKYIAEKVFGILQESWNLFNSVTLF